MGYLIKIAARCLVVAAVVFASAAAGQETKWNLLDALRMLNSTPTGRGIIEEANARALAMDSSLVGSIAIGEVSGVQNDFTFRFNPENPEQSLTDLSVRVFIDGSVILIDAALHLAHELVHFARARPPSPYDLDAAMDGPGAILRKIEGEGGEVDAFIARCRVFRELAEGLPITDSDCQMAGDGRGGIDREAVVKMYYRVGDYYGALLEMLGGDRALERMPHLSAEDAVLLQRVSADMDALPYPVTVGRIFLGQRRSACQTHRRRLARMEEIGLDLTVGYTRLSGLVEAHCRF